MALTRQDRSKVFLRPALFLAMALGLAACSSAGPPPMVTAARSIVGSVGGGTPEEQTTAAQQRAGLSRSAISLLNRPLLLVEWEARNAATVFLEAGQNGDVETWRSPDGLGVSLTEAGLLRSTRGYGADLMASNASASAAALATRRSGPVGRVMVYLDGELLEQPENHQCHMRVGASDTIVTYEQRYAVTQMTETCLTLSGQYENTYWVEPNGTVRRSRQWVSPEVGYFRIDRLN